MPNVILNWDPYKHRWLWEVDEPEDDGKCPTGMLPYRIMRAYTQEAHKAALEAYQRETGDGRPDWMFPAVYPSEIDEAFKAADPHPYLHEDVEGYFEPVEDYPDCWDVLGSSWDDPNPYLTQAPNPLTARVDAGDREGCLHWSCGECQGYLPEYLNRGTDKQIINYVVAAYQNVSGDTREPEVLIDDAGFWPDPPVDFGNDPYEDGDGNYRVDKGSRA